MKKWMSLTLGLFLLCGCNIVSDVSNITNKDGAIVEIDGVKINVGETKTSELIYGGIDFNDLPEQLDGLLYFSQYIDRAEGSVIELDLGNYSEDTVKIGDTRVLQVSFGEIDVTGIRFDSLDLSTVSKDELVEKSTVNFNEQISGDLIYLNGIAGDKRIDIRYNIDGQTIIYFNVAIDH